MVGALRLPLEHQYARTGRGVPDWDRIGPLLIEMLGNEDPRLAREPSEPDARSVGEAAVSRFDAGDAPGAARVGAAAGAGGGGVP